MEDKHHCNFLLSLIELPKVPSISCFVMFCLVLWTLGGESSFLISTLWWIDPQFSISMKVTSFLLYLCVCNFICPQSLTFSCPKFSHTMWCHIWNFLLQLSTPKPNSSSFSPSTSSHPLSRPLNGHSRKPLALISISDKPLFAYRSPSQCLTCGFCLISLSHSHYHLLNSGLCLTSN